MASLKNQVFYFILYNYIFLYGIALPVSSVFEGVPSDCTHYRNYEGDYQCSDNLKFNEKIQACDLPQNVNKLCNKPNATNTEFSIYGLDDLPRYLGDPECAHTELSYHPHPFDCRRFAVCYETKKWYLKCPEDFYFDKNSKTCKTQASSTCFVDARCTMDIDFLPHPTDCSSYIQCYFNISYVQKCPERMWFNSYKKLCTFQEDSDCVVTEPPWASPELKCSPYRKTDRSSYGCRFYLHCDSSQQGTLKACPAGTGYNAETQLCSVSNLEKCTDYGHTVAAWTTPPTEAPAPSSYGFPGCSKNRELFPHPADKHKFIECIENMGFERNCPEGLIFSRLHNPDRFLCF